jgi:alginate O-acetyltransferase complex protein AlgI
MFRELFFIIQFSVRGGGFMVFSNLVFLFVFLPIVIVLYYILPRMFRNYLLLAASLVFYAWGEPTYIFLMLFSISMNFMFGIWIDKLRERKRLKKSILVLSIISNLLILGYFKYAMFLMDMINYFFGLHIKYDHISLPIGISFFTFHAMSYIVDVYRNEVSVLRKFSDLALYISSFPQLVAGPIVRYNTVNDQIKSRLHSPSMFAEGVRRFIIGLSKKVLIANPMGDVADGIFALNATHMSVSTAWLGVLAYTLQIYFDFSGYSDMALGLGKMFGFKFLENFNYPYISQSIAEFWRRWHISLGTWFKDYVYIPLGGNRVGKWKTYRNLLIVWTITGFWHGASFTFMAWGFYYGLLICLERAGLDKVLNRMWRPFRHVYSMILVMIGWVFFRADNFGYSFEYIQSMFGLNHQGLVDVTTLKYVHDDTYLFIIAILFSLPIYHWIKRSIERSPQMVRGMLDFMSPYYFIAQLAVVTLFLVNSTYNPFIYYRF